MRVTIRPLEAADQAEFLRLTRASAEFHHPFTTMPVVDDHFPHYLDMFDGVTGIGFVVCLAGSRDIAGWVNITQIVRGAYQRGVLGFGAFVPYARKGYTSEAVGLAVRYAFDELGLHRLEADIEPANEPSRRLVRRLGFRQEGLSPDFIWIGGAWRDFERWAISTGTLH